jgi:hypothetical protein
MAHHRERESRKRKSTGVATEFSIVESSTDELSGERHPCVPVSVVGEMDITLSSTNSFIVERRYLSMDIVDLLTRHTTGFRQRRLDD